MSGIQEDAIHVMISQISRIWTQIPILGFNWSIFATEFNLSSDHLKTTDNIQIHQKNKNYRILEQAIFYFLNSFNREDPTSTLQMIRILAKEIVRTIIWDHHEKEYFKDRFAPIFRVAEIPLENTESIPLAAIVGKPYRFINEEGLSDFFLELTQEINITFNTGCYTSTAFLTRKLLESLVLSILMKEYGGSEPSKYLNNSGRTKGFEKLCKEFWTTFRQSLYKRTHVRNPADLQKLEDNLDNLRNEFNIDVHQLGNFKKQEDLAKVREDIQHLINFLLNLHSNMK